MNQFNLPIEQVPVTEIDELEESTQRDRGTGTNQKQEEEEDRGRDRQPDEEEDNDEDDLEGHDVEAQEAPKTLRQLSGDVTSQDQKHQVDQTKSSNQFFVSV